MSANNILSVDDNENDALLLKRACRNAKVQFNLISAEDGDLAIEHLSRPDRAPIAAMLLDLNMPRKTGFEVLQWLRDHSEAPKMPVIIFTSSNQESDIKRAYQMNAACYMVKPVQFSELIKIAQTIDGAIEPPEKLCPALATLLAFRAKPPLQ